MNHKTGWYSYVRNEKKWHRTIEAGLKRLTKAARSRCVILDDDDDIYCVVSGDTWLFCQCSECSRARRKLAYRQALNL